MLEMHGVSRRLASFHDVVPGYIFSGVYFSDKFIASHQDQVKAFLRGLIKSFDFIKNHEAKARSYIPKYTGVSQAVAMQSAIRDLNGRGRESLEKLDKQQDLLLKFGFLETKASLKEIVNYSFLPR
jgi:ABC-type nitrate/sulfonate/bicarbonate transport system substrate-binding protein